MLAVVQSLNPVRLFVTPRTAARQASLYYTASQSLLKLMSIESMILSHHFILYCSPLLLPSNFSSIRVFSSELALCIRWPKDWSFSFSIGPSNEYVGLILFRIDGLISLLSKGLSRVFSNPIVWKHQFCSFLYGPCLLVMSILSKEAFTKHSQFCMILEGEVLNQMFLSNKKT